MNSQIVWTKDGEPFMTHSLTQAEVATLYGANLEATPVDITKAQSISFADGTYCATITMTPTATVDGSDPVTKTSPQSCSTVVAKSCELTANCTLSGPSSHVATMQMSQSIKYTMNNWCDVNALTFSYTYQENGEDWGPVLESDVGDWEAGIAANLSFGSSWTQPEQDYSLSTVWSVTYDPPKFDSQSVVNANSSCDFNYLMKCVPKFHAAPAISEATDEIAITVDFQTATTGSQNCDPM